LFRGEKVVLRAMTRDDVALQAEWENDLETILLADDEPPQPRSLEQLQARFDHGLDGDARLTDNAWFAIETQGVCIGSCGLLGIHPTNRVAWLGICIGRAEYRGRGYGRDAIRLLLEYAFRYRNLRKVSLSCGSHNERGQRCYRACGFVEEGRLRQQQWCDGRYVDCVYMGIFREDWEKAH
jgi:RimJ/RimL family protein N-acetyltransferase